MAIVGKEKFSSAIGLVLLMEAIAVLVGPPAAGQSMQGITVLPLFHSCPRVNTLLKSNIHILIGLKVQSKFLIYIKILTQ